MWTKEQLKKKILAKFLCFQKNRVLAEHLEAIILRKKVTHSIFGPNIFQPLQRSSSVVVRCAIYK